MISGAASTILGGLAAHGNLDDGQYATYINQAETYLQDYAGQAQSGASAPAPGAASAPAQGHPGARAAAPTATAPSNAPSSQAAPPAQGGQQPVSGPKWLSPKACRRFAGALIASCKCASCLTTRVLHCDRRPVLPLTCLPQAVPAPILTDQVLTNLVAMEPVVTSLVVTELVVTNLDTELVVAKLVVTELVVTGLTKLATVHMDREIRASLKQALLHLVCNWKP